MKGINMFIALSYLKIYTIHKCRYLLLMMVLMSKVGKDYFLTHEYSFIVPTLKFCSTEKFYVTYDFQLFKFYTNFIGIQTYCALW